MKNKITIRELSKILKLSETVLRVHLSCFEKYKIPRTRPVAYFYNYLFLLDLRDFYKQKIDSISKFYESYKVVVTRLDEIIKLWEKMNKANVG